MDVADELRIASDGALVFRLEDRAPLRITGADRASWLNGVVTCDVTKLAAGGMLYGLAVTQKGRILADFYVIAEPDALVALLPSAEAENVRAAWEKYLVMEDCELAVGDDASVWRVVGQASHAATDAAKAAGASTGAGDAAGVVIAPRAESAKIEQAMIGAGAVLGSSEARDVLRHELGAPKFGVDFDGSLYPQEAALEKRAVSFDKGCYLGQEVVCMLEMRGHVKRKLVSLAVEAAASVDKGAPVTTPAGEKIGDVTSSVKSPTLGVLALAMVKASHMAEGTELRVGDAKAVVRA